MPAFEVQICRLCHIRDTQSARAHKHAPASTRKHTCTGLFCVRVSVHVCVLGGVPSRRVCAAHTDPVLMARARAACVTPHYLQSRARSSERSCTRAWLAAWLDTFGCFALHLASMCPEDDSRRMIAQLPERAVCALPWVMHWEWLRSKSGFHVCQVQFAPSAACMAIGCPHRAFASDGCGLMAWCVFMLPFLAFWYMLTWTGSTRLSGLTFTYTCDTRRALLADALGRSHASTGLYAVVRCYAGAGTKTLVLSQL